MTEIDISCIFCSHLLHASYKHFKTKCWDYFFCSRFFLFNTSSFEFHPIISLYNLLIFILHWCYNVIVLKVVFRKQHSTLGQQLLDLEYTSVRPGAKTLSAITRVQSLLYLICNVITPYLWARLRKLQAIRSFSDFNPHVSMTLTDWNICHTSLKIYFKKDEQFLCFWAVNYVRFNF